VQPFARELRVAVLDRGYGCSLLIGNQPDVDSLVEADPEASGPHLGNPVGPGGVTEEVVVEQQHVSRMRLTPPDAGDGLVGLHPALRGGDVAEGTVQAATPLRIAERMREVRVQAVVLVARPDTDALEGHPLADRLTQVPAGAADAGRGEDVQQPAGDG